MLNNISIIGLGLLGGSVAMAVSRYLNRVSVRGYAHRESTRAKALDLGLVQEATGDLKACVSGADLVILATPVLTFETLFQTMARALPAGCIVTDVGSTKALIHQWAGRCLPRSVHYVGSHPMAGSEQRGLEFARDDLFDRALCLLTHDRTTNPEALAQVESFWRGLGCRTERLTPTQHDRIVAHISHVPHALAAALINAMPDKELVFAGKGFMDTSRIASGPADVWADIFMTNPQAVCRGIDRVIDQLTRLRAAIEIQKRAPIERLLDKARRRRAAMIKDKIDRKELLA